VIQLFDSKGGKIILHYVKDPPTHTYIHIHKLQCPPPLLDRPHLTQSNLIHTHTHTHTYLCNQEKEVKILLTVHH